MIVMLTINTPTRTTTGAMKLGQWKQTLFITKNGKNVVFQLLSQIQWG